jgi:hypothetical protein
MALDVMGTTAHRFETITLKSKVAVCPPSKVPVIHKEYVILEVPPLV